MTGPNDRSHGWQQLPVGTCCHHSQHSVTGLEPHVRSEWQAHKSGRHYLYLASLNVNVPAHLRCKHFSLHTTRATTPSAASLSSLLICLVNDATNDPKTRWE